MTTPEPISAKLAFDPSPLPDSVTIENVPGMDGSYIRVPPGLTAAEVQHRLATWEPLKLCLQDYVVSDFEMGGTTIKANAHNGRLKRASAALAAADRETP